MDMIKAMQDTLALAKERNYDAVDFEGQVGVDFQHFIFMLQRAEDTPMSDGKLGRWLGYIQGVLVAGECCTLEEMKALNKKYADDWTHHHIKRGTKYKIVGQARAQCSVEPIKDGDMLTLYIGEDGVYSVRPPAEFNDGRFERINDPDSNYQKIADKIDGYDRDDIGESPDF
jgi:hypothetical protein